MKHFLLLLILSQSLFACSSGPASENASLSSSNETKESKQSKSNPVIVFETTMGNFEVELDRVNAPISTKNFENYVTEGFYNGTIFHRVIDGFMIQGGGFDANMNQKPTKEPIENEAGNGLNNDKYTIAMARTNVVNSATSQFFINVVDNAFLNHRDKSAQGFGYAVFGKVVSGFDVVDKIKGVKTGNSGGHQNVPVEPVIMNKVTLK